MAMSYLDYRVKHRQHQNERGEGKPEAPATGRQAGGSSPASSDAKTTKASSSGSSFLDYKVKNRKKEVKANGYERYGTYTYKPQASAPAQTSGVRNRANEFLMSAAERLQNQTPAYWPPEANDMTKRLAAEYLRADSPSIGSPDAGFRNTTAGETAAVMKQADQRRQEQQKERQQKEFLNALRNPNARIGGAIRPDVTGSQGNVDQNGRAVSPLAQRAEEEYFSKNPIDRAAYMVTAAADPDNPLNDSRKIVAQNYETMTDEEKGVYNYLYATRGPSTAEEYHNGLMDVINQRRGQEYYEQNLQDSSPLMKTAYSFGSGFGSGLEGIANLPNAMLGVENRKAKSPMEYTSGAIRSDENNSLPEQVVYDIASSTGNMAPGMIASALTGTPMLGSAVFAASAGGNAYAEALANGESVNTSQMYAAQQFVDEEVTNWLLGGINAFGGGALRNLLANSPAGQAVSEAVDNVVKSETGRRLVKSLLSYLGDMTGEAQQEYLQFFTENFTKALLGMKDENGNPTQLNTNLLDPDALYAAALGALNAGLLNVPSGAARINQGVRTDVSGAADFAQELAETPREAYTTDAAYESAQELQKLAEEIGQKENATAADRIAYNEAMNEFMQTAQEADAEEEVESQIEAEERAALNEEAVKELSRGFGEEGARAFRDMAPEQAVNSYRDFTAYYNHIRFGTEIPAETRATMTAEQISAAMKAGAADANAAYPQETVRAANKAVNKVSLENVKAGNVDTSGINYNNLTQGQKLRVDYAGALISKAFGMDVRFVESKAENGAYKGMNGSYQNINGRPTITLDVNAGMNLESDWTGDLTDVKTMLPVISHELTHHLEKANPELYKQLSNAVVQALSGNKNYTEGGTINEVIRAERNRMDRMEFDADGNTIAHTDSDAIHEIVARACEDFLSGDEKAVQVFENLDADTKKTLWDHVKEVFDNIKEFFTQMLSSYKSGSKEAQAIRQNMEEYERIRGIWQEALDNGTVVHASEMSTDAAAEATDGTMAGEFSIRQFAQALDLDVRLNSDGQAFEIIDPETGKAIKRVTDQMMEKTPMGFMVRSAQSAGTISKETADKQIKMFKDLMNLTLRYDKGTTPMVWEIAGSFLYSSVKTNSDKQYSTTVDYGTICSKTQALIDVLSKTMVEKGRGLTREEVIKAYNATANTGLSVPCPVCYVFSRWMGVPSLLETMRKCQDRFSNASEAEVQSYIKSMLDEYGDAKGVNSEKTKVQNRLATLERKLQEALQAKDTAEQAKIQKEVSELEDKMRDLESFNWVTQVRCVKEKNGGYKLDKKYKPVPNDILLDLTRSGDFAQKFPKSWKYRTTRGAGMGKAIMPYSGATIGDFIKGTKDRWTNAKNPFYAKSEKAAKAAIVRAQTRAKGQNLIGGQRFQSTSDFRAEWGIDYLMTFLECQAACSQVQLYTKVIEAVDMFASAGAEVNLSIMPKDNGHVNGKLVFSDVTGVNFEEALKKTRMYDNVQMILVGINDDHIRLAMADDRISFIIPWHSSGNSKDTLAQLMGAVGEKLDVSKNTDYSDFQNDKVIDNSDSMKAVRKFRKDIIQGKLWENYRTRTAKSLTAEQQSMLDSNPFLKELYRKFYQDTSAKEYGVRLNGNQSSSIFPYEYWDTSLTVKDADQNGRRFQEYCASLGIQPRFPQFANDPGYWKLLIDRRMYNRDGTYHAPKTIDVTNVKVSQVPQAVNSNNYKDAGKINQATLDTIRAIDDRPSDLTVTEEVGETTVPQNSARMENDDAGLYTTMRSALSDKGNGWEFEKIDSEYDLISPSGKETWFNSVSDALAYYVKQTGDDSVQKRIDAMAEFLKRAAKRGRPAVDRTKDSAGRKLSKAMQEYMKDSKMRTADGQLKPMFHGSETAGFTIFDSSASDDKLSLFFSDDPYVSESYIEGDVFGFTKDAPVEDVETFADRVGYFTEYEWEVSEDGLSITDDNGDVHEFNTPEETRDYFVDHYDTSGVYEVYLNITNPLELDAKGSMWNKLPSEYNGKKIDGTDTRAWAEFAYENGYDGVIFRNIIDNGGHGLDDYRESTVAVAFNSNQVKSVHNQNPTANDDIRYSQRGVDMSEELAASREQIDERYLARMADVIAEKDAEIEKLKAKMDKAVGVEKEKAKERLEKLRKEKNDRIAYLEKSYKANLDWRIAEMRQRMDQMKGASAEEKQRARERLEKLRAQKNQKIEDILQKNREQRLKRREKKAMQELLRRARRLMSESKKGSPEFKAQVDALIGDLDLAAAGLRDNTRAKLEELRKQVEAQSKLDPDYAKYEAPKYAELLSRIDPSRRHIKDMSIDEITRLTEAIVALEHSKQTADREIREGQGRLFGHYGKLAVEQQKMAKGINYKNEIGAQLGKYRLNMLNPVRGFALIDGYQKDGVFTYFGKQLNDGQTKAAQFRMEVEQMFHDIDQNKKLIDDFAKQNIEIETLEGTKKISKGMRIALYLHLQNLDNVKHIAFGGITIPNETLYKRGKYKEAYAAGETVHLSEWIPGALGENVLSEANRKNDAMAAAAIRKITDQMTPEEMEYAKIAQEFFNVKTKNAINEVSLELNGYEKATMDDYFPICTDKNYLASNYDGLMKDGTLEGMGMLKERVGSRLPIYLEDVSQVVLRQKNNTALYYGLAIPVRNFSKFYRYTGGERLERTVKKAVGNTWHQPGLDYIDHVLNDLQFGRQTQRTITDSLKSLYAGTTLNFNIGVSIKQSASYPFAASVIGWEPLIKAARHVVSKADREYMDSITPWGYMRRTGFSGTEMGEVAKQRTGIDNNRTIQKAKSALDLIRRVDVKTTEVLFFACEEYVKENYPDLEVRGKEYNKKLAEVYNETLQRTQPSYDVMQRNEFLRSQNDIAKIFGAFKTQTFNMGGEVLDAWGRWRAYSEYAKTDSSYKKDVKDAGKAFGNTVAATIAAQGMLVILTAAANAALHKMRDYRDEKGEVTPESVAAKILKDFGTSFAGLTMGGSEVQDFALALLGDGKWYDIDYPGLTLMNDFASASVDFKNAITKAVDTGDKKDMQKASVKMAKLLMQMFKLKGVPTQNVYNIANAIYLWGTDIKNGEAGTFNAGEGLFGLQDTSPTKQQYAKQAVDAYKRGDIAKGDRAVSRTSKDALKKAMGNGKGTQEDAIMFFQEADLTDEVQRRLWEAAGWKIKNYEKIFHK